MSGPWQADEHDAEGSTARALGLTAGELGSALADETALSALWERLEPAERAVLDALAELGGAAPPSLIGAEVAAAGAEALEEGLPTDESTAAIEAAEALESLWSSGLVQRDRATRDAWIVPELGCRLIARRVGELSRRLDPVDPVPPDPDEHLLLCAHALVRDEPVALTRAGRPHRRALDRIQESLSALLPPDGAEALLGELRRHGLLRLVGGTLSTDQAAASAWCALDRRERAARLLESEWGSSDALLVLRQLRVLPDRRWPEALSLRTMRRLLARTEGELGQVVSRHARALSALASAGLLARDRSGEGLALTHLGRSWPDPCDPPPGPSGFHVGNDLAVLVPRGLPAPVHLRLSRAARLEAGDLVARYRLERDSVLAALDAGEGAESFAAFLEARAEPVLPLTVKEDLHRWCERFGEVSAHAGIAVVCEVHARREEFGALVARSALALRLIAPGVAIVAPADHEALLGELSSAGFTPRRKVLDVRPAATPDRPALPRSSRRGADLEWAALRVWSSPAEAGRGRRASPPAAATLARLKDKYRREFGGRELASLDALPVEELLEMEERGLTRRYLSGADGARTHAARAIELSEHEGNELVPTSPRRAAAVLERCAQDSRRCEIAWRGEAGRRTIQAVTPLALLEEAGIQYVRLRFVPDGEERLIALDRVLALRVISTQR